MKVIPWCQQIFSVLMVAAAVLFLPTLAFAQSTISGRVADTTGAVLPGVTVEARSPALIEGARVVITDGQGRYSIVELRPGEYVVTFTLPGFNTVRREGIEVVSDVNVPVNAEMQVGALQETITVSGATPVVDVQQAGQRQVIPKEMLDALPTARATNTVGSVISGMKLTKPDFGGTTSFLQAYITSRGKDGRENTVDMDGMDVRMIRGCQAQGYTNFAMAEEVSVETNAPTAEVSGGGVRINMIPREGGNQYAGDVYFGGMTDALQANNITDELIAAGLPTPTATKNILEINPAFGGPIVRDKLWFMASIRHLGVELAPAGAINSDGSQGFNQTYTESLTGRLTWQATETNKITAYRDHSFRYQSHVDFSVNAGDEWDRVTNVWDWGRGSFIGGVKWTSPVNNRLLLENGYSRNGYNVPIYGWQPGILRTEGTAEWFANASRFDQSTGRTTVAPTNDCCHIYKQPSHVWTSAVSYVTGSHSFKAGLQYRWGETDVTRQQGNGALQQLYINGVPDAVSVTANPSRVRNQVRHDVGLYVQDAWTIDRLTLNAGVRWEYFEWGVGEAASPAGRFIDARFTQAATPVPAFNDIAPRFSATYDLFGDARTALKFSAGKYVGTLGATTFAAFNPIDVSSNTRNWFDTDLVPGTSTPSGVALPTNGDDIAQDNEIGPSTNERFGVAALQRAADDLQRAYTWDYSVAIQQQLMPGVSITGAWYHTRNYDLQQVTNVLLGLSDYAPFEIVSPLTGEPVTVFNLDPALGSAVDNVTGTSDINRRTYNGFELSVNARLPNGGTMLAGWFTERTVEVTCDTNDPNQLRYCDESGQTFQELGEVPSLPFRNEFKLAVSYPLPYDFETSAALLSYPGAELAVSYPVPAGDFPMGRTRSVTLDLIPPGTKHAKRWNQFDLSVKRRFRAGRFEFLPTMDIYNLFNSSVVLSEFQSFGPSLGRPFSTLQGRMMRLSVLTRF